MNDNEAKFLLRAFRPDGSDALDPRFADALAQAEKSPALQSWFKREKSFDCAIAGKLREVQPSAGLRDAILAGGRVSQRPQTRRKNFAWLALAASIALTLTVALRLHHTGPSAHDFAEFALTELATASDQHHGGGPEQAAMQARLANSTLPLPGSTTLDPAELRRAGCHTVAFAGHEVFEICFVRDGKMFHLYAARTKDFAAGAAQANALVTTKGRFAATAWKDNEFTYALVTEAGTEALRKLI
jgi:hypothetical protein